MNKTSRPSKGAADTPVGGIKRKMRNRYSSEKKIRILLADPRREERVAALCRQEVTPGTNIRSFGHICLRLCG